MFNFCIQKPLLYSLFGQLDAAANLQKQHPANANTVSNHKQTED